MMFVPTILMKVVLPAILVPTTNADCPQSNRVRDRIGKQGMKTVDNFDRFLGRHSGRAMCRDTMQQRGDGYIGVEGANQQEHLSQRVAMAPQISGNQYCRYVVGQEKQIEPEVERRNKIIAAVGEEPPE